MGRGDTERGDGRVGGRQHLREVQHSILLECEGNVGQENDWSSTGIPYHTCTTYHFSMLGTSVALPFVYMCVRLNFHDFLHFQYPFPRSCIHCSFVLCTNFVLWVLLKGYIVKAVCECSCTLSLSLLHTHIASLSKVWSCRVWQVLR